MQLLGEKARCKCKPILLDCRPVMGKHEDLKRITAEAPGLALRLLRDTLEQGAPKKRVMPEHGSEEVKRMKHE